MLRLIARSMALVVSVLVLSLVVAPVRAWEDTNNRWWVPYSGEATWWHVVGTLNVELYNVKWNQNQINNLYADGVNGYYRCGTLLDAPLVAGSVAGLCRATAAALAGPVAAVGATLPVAPVVNADETRWPHAGRTAWLWVAVTGLATVFTIAASRGNRAIKALLGEDYTGVVGSDRYSAYAWLDEACRQVCWAHLKRDFAGLVDRGGAAKEVGTAALALVHDLFAVWHQYRAGHLDRAGLSAQMQPVQDAFDTLLDAAGIAGPDPRAATLCRALDRLWPALWTFVDADGVAPTNNAAERALRPAVLWRKGSYGTQSEGGARFAERLLTVTATCRQHGRSVLDYLTDACTAVQRGLPAPSLLLAPAAT